jgi:hypothetical protein
MTSEKQIEANRLNALKSTGPTTPAGKARSAQNAVTHGLTAESVLLPGEDADAFAEFEADYIRELRPTGRLQRTLVAEIVADSWRLGRIPMFEASAIRLKITKRVRDDVELPGFRVPIMTRAEMERAGIGPDDIAQAVLDLDEGRGFFTTLTRNQRTLTQRRAQNLALLFTLQARDEHEAARQDDRISPEVSAEDHDQAATGVDPVSGQMGAPEPYDPDISAMLGAGSTSSLASEPSSVVTDKAATTMVTVSERADDHRDQQGEKDGETAIPVVTESSNIVNGT